MQTKTAQVSRYWGKTSNFQAYQIDPKALTPFNGSHPAVMKTWLETEAEWGFAPSEIHIPNSKELKHRVLMAFERWSHLDLSHKNFKFVK